jgi:hypothetical protein
LTSRPVAPLVGALAVLQAYVLCVHGLPRIHPDDLSVFVAATCATAGIYLCIATTVGVSDDLRLLTGIVIVGIALVAVFAIADLGAAATPVEALAYGALGARLAVGLLEPVVALALPLVVAVVDVASTLGGGLSEHLANGGTTKPGDPLSLEMPDWGNGMPAGRMGVSDAIFAGVFLLFARRLGLRPVATAIGFWLVTVLAIGLHLEADAAIPALPLFAAVYYVVNADRLRTLLGLARQG